MAVSFWVLTESVEMGCFRYISHCVVTTHIQSLTSTGGQIYFDLAS